MKRYIREYYKSFLYIFGLMVIAGVVGGYILVNQRVRFPFVQDKTILMHADLDSAQAVTPGQGQSVQVAGVKIGQIAAVKLREGVARLDLQIEPKFRDLVRTDSKALLRPRTGLKDMYLQVVPGKGKQVEEGFTIPLARTISDVDLDEILESLDARTRDYLVLLVKGGSEGLEDNGAQLAEVFERFAPTARDLATVSRAVTARKGALSRAITNFGRLNERLAEDPEALTQLVDSGARTFAAFADEQDNLRATVRELPDTLRRASLTLERVEPFANELGPATRALVPALQALDGANDDLTDLGQDALKPVRDQIRPFTREARPLVRDLAPAARSLSALSPELTRVGTVFNRFFNMLAHNPNGREGQGVANREEGFLYWLAWATHNSANLFNVEDANGPMRPIFLTGTCGTLASLVSQQPELEAGLGLSALLATLCDDPQTPSVDKKLRETLAGGGEKAEKAAAELDETILEQSRTGKVAK